VGAFLSSSSYYVGLSIPKIIQNDIEYKDGSYSSFSEMRHFFLIGAYVFNFSNDLKFKPTGLLKATEGSPLQFDLTANFLIKDRIWLGAMYRWGDSFGFIGQFVLDEHIRIGYAIDFTTTKLRNHSNGTHESMISYELGMRKQWNTPRMF
jgi:type IX secretion system PorP/SprF family membrane protein